MLLLAPLATELQAQSSDDFVPVTDAMLQNPAPEDWLMWRRTLDSWGYSPLDQVNRENVGELQMVWTRDLEPRTGEITPLAYGGLLYVPQASDVIQALDAVTGDFVWEYSRDIPEDLYTMVGGNARNNRNIAIYGRTIINTSDDNFVFAIDALTGETVWKPRSSTTRSTRLRTAPAPSSRTAGSFRGVAAGPGAGRTRASSRPTTLVRARSCGGGA